MFVSLCFPLILGLVCLSLQFLLRFRPLALTALLCFSPLLFIFQCAGQKSAHQQSSWYDFSTLVLKTKLLKFRPLLPYIIMYLSGRETEFNRLFDFGGWHQEGRRVFLKELRLEIEEWVGEPEELWN